MSLWYIGDPCYAIEDDRWIEFCDNLFAHKGYKKKGQLGDGLGIEMKWDYTSHFEELEALQTTTLYIYDSPMGDGCWNVHGYSLGVDAGLLSVLPIEVCTGLKDPLKIGDNGGGAVVESKFRPVFETSQQFPYVQLDIAGNIEQDTTGHSLCDICEEWAMDNDMLTNPVGEYCCSMCYEEGDDEW